MICYLLGCCAALCAGVLLFLLLRFLSCFSCHCWCCGAVLCCGAVVCYAGVRGYKKIGLPISNWKQQYGIHLSKNLKCRRKQRLQLKTRTTDLKNNTQPMFASTWLGAGIVHCPHLGLEMAKVGPMSILAMSIYHCQDFVPIKFMWSSLVTKKRFCEIISCPAKSHLVPTLTYELGMMLGIAGLQNTNTRLA